MLQYPFLETNQCGQYSKKLFPALSNLIKHNKLPKLIGNNLNKNFKIITQLNTHMLKFKFTKL